MRRERLPASDLAAEMMRIEAARALPPVHQQGRRRFDAATQDRLTSSWMATNTLIDQELRGDLDRLRARSRDLARNNEYIKSWLRAVRRNVVGPSGPVLQCRVADLGGTPDTLANQVIEAAWYRQMRRGNFEVTGKLSGVDALAVLITAAARDGELLYRVARGPGFGEFGFQIQPLDVARIATSMNRERTGSSNAITMGVEVDEYGRPVAIHCYMASTLAGTVTRSSERIPTTEIRHAFLSEDAEQTRGYPWAHAAIKRLHDLNGYREAAVIAARIGASKMGFFSSKDGDPSGIADQDKDTGEFMQNVAPGEFGVLPHGYDFTAFDPSYPHDQFEAFNKAVLRGISSALGVSYNTMANDLEGVNYSSIRAGVLDERDEWMALQEWFISSVVQPIYEEWLEWTLLGGMLVMPNGSTLPAAKLSKFRQHIWQPRRWAWVDPLKDVESAVVSIQNGLESPQQVAARAGRDVEDILDDLATFQKLAAAKGVQLPGAAYSPKPDPPAPPA
jgi:lambda family phage portal protein